MIVGLSLAIPLVAFVLLLGSSSLEAAEPQESGYTVPREGVVIDGRLYVGAGVASRGASEHQALASLWGSPGVPDFNEALYRERWKTVGIDHGYQDDALGFGRAPQDRRGHPVVPRSLS